MKKRYQSPQVMVLYDLDEDLLGYSLESIDIGTGGGYEPDAKGSHWSMGLDDDELDDNDSEEP